MLTKTIPQEDSTIIMRLPAKPSPFQKKAQTSLSQSSFNKKEINK